MSKLARWAGRLYPSAWRKRYGAEFDALLEQATPGSGDLWNIVRGAFIMRIIRLNFLTITVAFALAGASIAGIWSLTRPSRYMSTAIVRADLPGPPTARNVFVELAKARQVALSRGSLAEIIIRGDLYRDERTTVPMEDVVAAMRRDVRISYMDKGKVAVRFQYPDAARAQRTVQDTVTALQRPMAAAGKLEIVDPASLPRTTTGPDRSRLMGVGLIGGFLAGVLCGSVWTLIRNRKGWSLKLIGAFAVAGMAAGIVISLRIPNQYESIAVIRSTRVEASAAMDKAFSEETLTKIIRKEGLYQSDLAQHPMADVVSRMRNQFVRVRMVVVAPPDLPALMNAVTISFRGRDRIQAQRVTRALVAAWIQTNQAAGANVEILDPPSDPVVPFTPNRPQIATVGTFGGLLLGFAVTRLRRAAMATA